MPPVSKLPRKRKGATLVLSMLFIVLFSALAVSMATVAGTNTQVASNQHKANTALYAAQSGIECVKYIINTINLGETNQNYVTPAEANNVWIDLRDHIQAEGLNGVTTLSEAQFCDSLGSGDELTTPSITFDSSGASFILRLYRYNSDPLTIRIQSTGSHQSITRRIGMNMSITKSRDVLHYAIASRGRMWLTGDTTIHGPLFSTWDVASVSPFNITSDSSVLGTINTVLRLDQILSHGYQMETLDDNGKPIFEFGQTVYDDQGHALSDSTGTIDKHNYLVTTDGEPVYDAGGQRLFVDYNERFHSYIDEVQGYHENINYYDPEEHSTDVPGMDITDYDTSSYYNRTIVNPIEPETQTVTYWKWGRMYTREETVTTTEYFPHGPDGYDDYKSGCLTVERCVYENQTFTDAYLSSNQNALFENCTFEGVLYVDCDQVSQTSGHCNNVRFNNCTFNGVIVTNVPDDLSWQRNALYFTGEATFNNTSDIQEATILAPHFNVDLGNTNPQQSDNNVLTGAIVGGIVDVRGNAQIYGTIISMCDTTSWTSGFVTNIGATLEDGGSETTTLGDIGVISITPEAELMLPSGITSPIIIQADQTTYTESA